MPQSSSAKSRNSPPTARLLFAGTGLAFPSHLAFTDDNGVPLPLANQVPEPSLGLLSLGLVIFITRTPRRGETCLALFS